MIITIRLHLFYGHLYRISVPNYKYDYDNNNNNNNNHGSKLLYFKCYIDANTEDTCFYYNLICYKVSHNYPVKLHALSTWLL